MGRGLFLLPEKAHFNSYSSCSDKTTRVKASIERLRFAKQIERCEAAACRDACHAPTANLKVGERRSPSCFLLVCPFHPPFQSVSAWDLNTTCTCPPSPTAWDALPAPSFRGLWTTSSSRKLFVNLTSKLLTLDKSMAFGVLYRIIACCQPDPTFFRSLVIERYLFETYCN